MKQWVVREEVSQNLLEQVLFYRGIKTREEIERFLNPDYKKDPHDPFEILNMDRAVERILRAIKDKERIIVYGDYDADGVCASVIFHDFFRKIGFENFHIHIPDRHLDGYGLTSEAIDEFIEQKARLIITLDCGITDVEEVEKALAAGIDVVIVDHHLPPEELPPAFAIIDSKQKEDKYSFKFLSGAGVAFKVVQAVLKKGGFLVIPGWEKWLLDLVAIATIADMVPLVDENRVLTHYGLMVLRRTRRSGLLSFFRRLDINPANINEDDVAFMIAPRINIASRMDHANTSFQLLTTESAEEADWLSSHLEVMNQDRKKAVDDIMTDIDKKIKTRKTSPKIIVDGDLAWHPGILGIAANRLLDKYQCPVFLWGKSIAKQIKGSCRSDGSVNLVEMMKAIPEGILIEQGGHALAGGFSVDEKKIDILKNEIKKVYEKMPKEKTENGMLYIDKEMKINDANWNSWEMIEKLQPFGMDNPKPVFKFSNLDIAEVKKFGNAGIHLRLNFKKSDGGTVSAIGFFMANQEKFDLSSGQRVDLAATLEKSVFRAQTELRLKIVDIKRLV